MIKKLSLPYTSERIRGVTLPKDNIMYVCDYDEVHKLTIGNEITAEILDDDPYDFLDAQEHSLGLSEDPPIHKSGENTITYSFKPTADNVAVHLNINGKNEDINFKIMSGDWFEASFSKCGKYILIAEPYEFELYEIE